jgi:hypothetical protein
MKGHAAHGRALNDRAAATPAASTAKLITAQIRFGETPGAERRHLVVIGEPAERQQRCDVEPGRQQRGQCHDRPQTEQSQCTPEAVASAASPRNSAKRRTRHGHHDEHHSRQVREDLLTV